MATPLRATDRMSVSLCRPSADANAANNTSTTFAGTAGGRRAGAPR
ncbi:MAG: hypothetical protein L6Q60_14440 [Rhodocyclaceae bacterium]|nr:hypothetical protein [Rhodocyclaceae bacterium]